MILLRPVDLRAFVQQQPRRVDVAVLAGVVQERLVDKTILAFAQFGSAP